MWTTNLKRLYKTEWHISIMLHGGIVLYTMAVLISITVAIYSIQFNSICIKVHEQAQLLAVFTLPHKAGWAAQAIQLQDISNSTAAKQAVQQNSLLHGERQQPK